MYKPFSAPHRVVCKPLLVSDEDEKKPKKKSAKSSHKNIDVKETVVEVNSAHSVPLNNAGSDGLSNNLEKQEEIQNDVLNQQQRKLHQIANNLNDLRGSPSKTASAVSTLASLASESKENLENDKISGPSLKSDGKERKTLWTEKKSPPKKQVCPDDSLLPRCTVNKYDKKETREYIRKKKLERQEKEQQELLKKKLELESRRKKLMELRDTTLKVLKASIKKRSLTKNEEELERNWQDLDDDENLDIQQLTLNTYSDMRNMNNGCLRNNVEFNSVNLQRNSSVPSKIRHMPSENTQQKVVDTKSNDVFYKEQHPSFSNYERDASHSRSSVPNHSALTGKTQPPLRNNHLQSINEIDDKKQLILCLSDEVNRLSSSIKFLKENASKTLLETNKMNAKSTNNFHNCSEKTVARHKLEISKSCHSIPQEMVHAVSELKDTLTLLSQTSLHPASSGRISNSVKRYPVPSVEPLPYTAPVRENYPGAFKTAKRNNIIEENDEATRLQSVYERRHFHPKHHGHRSKECKNTVSNGESDHSISSGFMLGSNDVSEKDIDSDNLSVQWLKMFASKPNPMNFITTLKSKLNLESHTSSHAEKENKKLRMEKMFDALNEKFQENIEKSSEKSLCSESNGEKPESTSSEIPSCEPLVQSKLCLKVPSKLSSFENHRKHPEYLLTKNGLQETEDQFQVIARKPYFSKESIPTKLINRKQESSKGTGSPVKEPNLISSQKPTDCVFLPLSIAHFPSADELKQSGISSTRSSKNSSGMQPLTCNERPLVVPELHLKSGLVSSTDFSSYHSKSNSELSTQSKADTLPASSRELKPVPIQLRQVTVADKSSLSSMSDLSEQTIEKIEKFENKENVLPKSLDVKSDSQKLYNPSDLRLHAEAELKQIDIYTESLEQLVEAEHDHNLTLAKEAAGVQEWKANARKDESRNATKSRKKSAQRSVSTTPSLTEITDTSTIMSELLLLPNMELNRPSFNFKFSPDQAVNKQSLQMLEQLLKDEAFWANHQKESLKLREKALLNSIKVGIVWFEVQKKQLKESRQEHLIKNLKKKQRGLLLKLQQEKEEIAKLQKTISSASEERRLILLQQYQLVKSQLSTKDFLKRRKVDSLPVKSVSVTKYFAAKPSESQVGKSADAEKIVCDKNLGQTLLEGLRALEQEKYKISEREKQLIEHSKNVDELLQWKKKFKDMERQTGSSRPLRDRSTSPFRMTPEPCTGIVPSGGGDAEIVHTSQSSKKGLEDIQVNQCSDHHNALHSSNVNLEANAVHSVDHYGSESVESPESSETPRAHQPSGNVELSNAVKNMSLHTKQTSIHIKTPLSPRLQNSRRLRYSSGSDDSMIFSQNETLSEQSETEVRVSALHEQLKQRKLEAERLQREHKRAQKERLKMKEQALIKQIQAYDEYIQKTRRELEQEMSQAITPIVRPQIKQPRVAEKTVFKKQDSVPLSNTSESNDLPSHKVPVSDGQKTRQEKFLEPEDSGLEVIESIERVETGTTQQEPATVEKEPKQQESLEEQLFPFQIFGSVKTDKQESSSVSKTSTAKSRARSENDEISATPPTVPSLILRSDTDELQDELLSESEKVVTSAVFHSPEFSSAQKMSELVSAAKSDSSAAKSLEEMVSHFMKRSSKLASEGLRSIEELEQPVENQQLDISTGSEIPDSVSEMSSLPTAQESDGSSVKEIVRSPIDLVSKQVKENSLSSDQSHKSSVNVETLASSECVVKSEETTTIASISSHLEASVVESNEPVSEKVESGEENIKATHVFSKESGEDNTEICSVYVEPVEKSAPEVFSDPSQESETDKLRSEYQTENVPSLEIGTVSLENIPVFDSDSNVQAFSDVFKSSEDWVDADDFFETHFPTTNKLEQSSEYKQMLVTQTEKQFETPKADIAVSDHMSGESSPKLDSAKIIESAPEVDIPSSERFEKFSGLESDRSSEKSDEDDDTSSKCDSSVASKASVSSIKVSDSGKSYEKDRSITEVIENCEVSELLDSSSTSNESCKTFDHDFDETKDVSDIFSSTFIINEEKCPSQPERKSSEMTDRIADEIMNTLLQDSFDCIKREKVANKESEKFPLDTVSMLETPFIEALKRDHEALKVKSQRAETSKNDVEVKAVESRDKLYNAINVAEMLLGVCLNDATETMLEIRSNKIDYSDASNSEKKSLQEKHCTSVSDDVSHIPSSDKPAAEGGAVTILNKDPIGVGLGDDVDFCQDWLIDEEYVRREAEKLRLKQLQIEQEIEQLQQAQQQAPYIYERFLREIPNKPPPPYTPPVQPESVPTDKNIVLNIVTSAASHIYDSRLIHVEPKPPPSFTSDKNNSLAIYKKFLYDLCLQLMNEIYADDHNETAVPWEKTIKRKAKTKVPVNKAMLIEEIQQKVSILFGYRKKVGKENLIIRWSRKKRDHVDELLVREAQEEEQEWTNYEFDEITVKNQVTTALLNSLLNNTAIALGKALQNKLEKLKR